MAKCIKIITWKCSMCGKIYDEFREADHCCLSDDEVQTSILNDYIKEFGNILKVCPKSRDVDYLYNFYRDRLRDIYNMRDRYILDLGKYDIRYYTMNRKNVYNFSNRIDDVISESFRKSGNYKNIIEKEYEIAQNKIIK